jgi:uncharacterized protein (DUF1800 family)
MVAGMLLGWGIERCAAANVREDVLMTTYFRFRRALFALCGTTAFACSTVSAQVSNCPFAVSGASAPKFSVDGMLLVRYAVGLRSTALSNRISGTSTFASAETTITANLSRLDMDGDNEFGPNDALIILRYLSGFSRDTWTRGMTFSLNAQRKNGVDIERFMNNGCPAPASSGFTSKDAARLLQQATWGATLTEIDRVKAIGVNSWLNEQFAVPATSYTSYATGLINANKGGANGCTDSNGCPWAANTPAFYKQAFEGSDQLRQRVVNALLQIMVVSTGNNRLQDAGTGVASYMDMLGTHAFGNFQTLLKDVTLHPAMGVYLDMLGSTRENPNENYARELLQLFSIGMVMLNDDGTPKVLNRAFIPTYTEATVQGFSKAFTGWQFPDQNEAEPWRFYWPAENWTAPMKPWTGRRCPQDGRWPAGSTTQWCSVADPARSYPPPHNTESKTLLQYSGAPNATLPAGRTPEQDVDDAINNIFYHPNVGPFIGRQLIQRLVTSNPSPAYVGRVTAAFNNNGSGERGDMKAVVRAILTDNEARDNYIAGNTIFGKLREPVIKFIHLHRAFGARASGGYYDVWDTGDTDTLGQSALRAPSVFNYYSPDFEPAGAMASAFLLGPEFEITSTSSVAGFADFTGWGVVGGFRNGDANQGKWIKPNYDRYLVGAAGVALADDPQKLVDDLDLLLTANNLKPTFKSNLVEMVGNIIRGNIDDQRRDRFRAVMWQIIHSADYAVQR